MLLYGMSCAGEILPGVRFGFNAVTAIHVGVQVIRVGALWHDRAKVTPHPNVVGVPVPHNPVT